MEAAVVMRGLVLVVWAGATTAAAQQLPTPEQTASGVDCITTGYDIVLVNQGTDPLPAGTALSWSVGFVRLDGTHLLEADLPPGGAVHLTGALVSTYLAKPKPCVVTLVPQ